MDSEQAKQLHDMVARLDELEQEARSIRTSITLTLMENKHMEFFSVDWTKLRRMFR